MHTQSHSPHRRRLAVLVAGTIAATAACTAVLVGVATGDTAPPWEPDPQTATPYGNLVFYDSAGHVITHGSDLTHVADFAAATSAGDTSITAGTAPVKATLYFATPKFGTVTSAWTSAQASAPHTFPDASAPAPIAGPSFTAPVGKFGASDGNISAYLGGHPTDSNAGYSNVIQVRMTDSNADGDSSAPNYWATDITVDPDAGTWTQLYPTPVSVGTTTVLSADPLSGAGVQGSTITLTATVTADDASAPEGTVQFKDGSTNIGTPVTLTPGSGQSTANTPWTPSTAGDHSLHAVFTTSDSTSYATSTGDLTYTVAAATPKWKPTMIGTVRVGATVTCVASFDYATSVTYQWLVNGVANTTTTSTYKIAESNYTKNLSCSVTATNGSGGPQTSGTSSSAKVALGAPLVPTKKPFLYNKNRGGVVIHGTYEYCTIGTWSPTAQHVSFQWFVNTTRIVGATKSAFKIPASYVGKYLSCVVTATHNAYLPGKYHTAKVRVAK